MSADIVAKLGLNGSEFMRGLTSALNATGSFVDNVDNVNDKLNKLSGAVDIFQTVKGAIDEVGNALNEAAAAGEGLSKIAYAGTGQDAETLQSTVDLLAQKVNAANDAVKALNNTFAGQVANVIGIQAVNDFIGLSDAVDIATQRTEEYQKAVTNLLKAKVAEWYDEQAFAAASTAKQLELIGKKQDALEKLKKEATNEDDRLKIELQILQLQSKFNEINKKYFEEISDDLNAILQAADKMRQSVGNDLGSAARQAANDIVKAAGELGTKANEAEKAMKSGAGAIKNSANALSAATRGAGSAQRNEPYFRQTPEERREARREANREARGQREGDRRAAREEQKKRERKLAGMSPKERIAFLTQEGRERDAERTAPRKPPSAPSTGQDIGAKIDQTNQLLQNLGTHAK